MRDALRFTVLGPPVPKERPRVIHGATRTGRHYSRTFTPERTAGYEKLVGDLCRAAARSARWSPEGEAFGVYLYICLPDRRGRDGDNIVKAVLDGMNGVAYEDDSRVSRLGYVMVVDRERPRVEVRVWRTKRAEIQRPKASRATR